MDTKPWYRLKEESLMDRRISDLNLQIAGSSIAPYIQKLYDELEKKGLAFRPPCFLADEWFCPVGVPVVGIPFYLSHTRLRRLEQKIMLELEGGTKSWFMKLLRHETGHAYSYAYGLHKKDRWRRLFGSPSKEYPDTYRPKPYSRSFVVHLDNWYAQSHPDEDFAESFAVWLTPGHNWRKRYRKWKVALEKLEYVDRLMNTVAGKPPKKRPRFRPEEYSGLQIKLKTYYRQKKKQYEDSYPDFYDKDLRQLFTDIEEEQSGKSAAKFLKAAHEQILKPVSLWTGEKKYAVDQLMRHLRDRCDDLNLYVRKDDKITDFHITSYITTLVMTYLFTGKFKRSK